MKDDKELSNLLEAIDTFEKELGLPKRFYFSLIVEDDWSFIIKMHALLEAASTQMLVYNLNEPDLEEVFSNIEMSDRKKGKLAFLKALDLMPSAYRGYIQQISEIRNAFAHKVSCAGISIEEYIDGQTDNKTRKKLVSMLEGFIKDPVEIGEVRVPKQQFINENIKHCLWMVGMDILERLHLHRIESKVREITLRLGEKELRRAIQRIENSDNELSNSKK